MAQQPSKRVIRSLNSLVEQQENNAPMIEIFGGAFALMLVLIVLVNAFSTQYMEERLEDISQDGSFRIGWGSHGEGFVVNAFPNYLYLIETAQSVATKDLCKEDSPFVQYVQKIYRLGQNSQIIFSILQNGVATMAHARNCMMRVLPGRPVSIGWIIANNELLKSISIDDIPAHIIKAIQ